MLSTSEKKKTNKKIQFHTHIFPQPAEILSSLAVENNIFFMLPEKS